MLCLQRLSLNGTVESRDLVNVTITVPPIWGEEIFNATITGKGYMNVRATANLIHCLNTICIHRRLQEYSMSVTVRCTTCIKGNHLDELYALSMKIVGICRNKRIDFAN